MVLIWILLIASQVELFSIYLLAVCISSSSKAPGQILWPFFFEMFQFFFSSTLLNSPIISSNLYIFLVFSMKKITECKTMCWAPHFQFLYPFFPSLWWLIMNIGGHNNKGGHNNNDYRWSFKTSLWEKTQSEVLKILALCLMFVLDIFVIPLISLRMALLFLISKVFLFYFFTLDLDRTLKFPCHQLMPMEVCFFLVSPCKVLIVWLSSSISQPHAALRPPPSVPVQTWNSSLWIIKTENTPRVHHSSL